MPRPFGLSLSKLSIFTPPHPINRRLHLCFHPSNKFAVAGDQRLLGFDLGDDGALGLKQCGK